MADHVTHLVIHGVLHLLGYDHVRDKDATLMEGLETAILGKMGLSDPYEG
jgi:probable rRNA maturation factor